MKQFLLMFALAVLDGSIRMGFDDSKPDEFRVGFEIVLQAAGVDCDGPVVGWKARGVE